MTMINARTFSICAVDPASGTCGVAVASRCIAVGALVPFAEPGVGAIANQACCNPRYGGDGLALLRKGVPADEVIRRLLAADLTTTADSPSIRAHYEAENMKTEGEDYFRAADSGDLIWRTSRIRQLAVVDRHGRSACHSGACIFPWAGFVSGPGFCCQGNTLTGEAVVQAMADAYLAKPHRSMTERLIAALIAGEAEGGDRRGKQAAAILVTADRGHWTGSDRACDVRVDDHPEPVRELRRIIEQHFLV